MNMFNFKIPVSSEYCHIKEAIGVNNIPNKLKEAKQSFKENGVEFIIAYFDVYVAVIVNKDKVRKDLVIDAYEDLHEAMNDLDKRLTLLSEENSLSDKVKRKYLNIIKMLTYTYVNIIPIYDMKDTSKRPIKKNKKKELNIEQIIFRLNSILHQKINVFWNPPVVEQPLIKLFAQICYYFIERPSIKSNTDVCNHIFHLFGTLLRDHKYRGEFVHRLTELIKSNEHVIQIVCDGIKLLVCLYDATDLVKQFVDHISDWQRNQPYQSYQTSLNCAEMLLEMSILMPEFMVEEVKVLVERFSDKSSCLIISFLNVITEVLLRILSKPVLTEDESKLRSEFIVILNKHILHESPFVRVRVIQNWCRLQKEKAIPKEKHAQILQMIACQIKDEDSNVRISAVNCVTSFLKHNPFGSEFQMNLTMMEKSLEEVEYVFEELKEEILEKMWKNMKGDIIKTFEGNISEDDDNNSKEFNLDREKVVHLVQIYLTDKKYDEAIKITKKAVKHIEQFANVRETIEHTDENDFLLKLMYRFFVHDDNNIAPMIKADAEDFCKINTLEKLVKHYGCVVSFLEVLHSCTDTIKDLLESYCATETQEAIDFFVTGYNFNIQDAVNNIIDMLYMIPRSLQDRKAIIIKAFQSILLETDATSVSDRSNIIVDRLIRFMIITPVEAYDYLKEVISSWVADEILDKNVIECLFEYFVEKQNVSKEESLKALQVLIMIAPTNNTIVTKNLRVITDLIFEKRGVEDMMLLAATCDLLAAGTVEQQKFNNRKPLFKVKPTDKMWKNLIKILYDNFDKSICCYDRALKEGTKFIYALCSKPDEMCEKFIISVLQKIGVWMQPNPVKIKAFILTRLCNLLGQIGICRTRFLDDAAYKRIKKSLYIATEKIKKQEKEEIDNATEGCHIATLNYESATVDSDDQSALEKPQDDKMEVDFILEVLETEPCSYKLNIGAFESLILRICENLDKYDNKLLQCSAVFALLRYTVVFTPFCSSYLKVIFTLLERSKCVAVKRTVIMNIYDLLEKFPNLVESWSVPLYNRLRDSKLEIRYNAFNTLSSLLLKDMLRVNSNVAILSEFISEEDEYISDISKNFFINLARNTNQLYNIFPDICSHLIAKEDIDDKKFRYIMKFLTGLITSPKHFENLVDRLCAKFWKVNDMHVCRNIAYCLTLLSYNEEAVEKFVENFYYYRHSLHDTEVYTSIKQIINSWATMNGDVRHLSEKIFEKINKVLQTKEISEDSRTSQVSDPTPWSNKSSRRAEKRKQKKKATNQAATNNGENASRKFDALITSTEK